MSGEWKGWNDWNGYEEAGIVEHDVDFSDEDIIIDHAIGRTKKAIGKCWPMDAALAYTLVKAGPHAELTWDDMVNDYTKSATIMMTGKVARDWLPKLNVESCGHDEINGYIHKLAAPRVITDTHGNKKLAPQYGWSSKTMRQWLDEVEASDELKDKYSEIRLSDKVSINGRNLLEDDYFAELLDLIKNNFESFDYVSVDNWVKNTHATKGVCKWADDDDKQCAHHDAPKERYWALYKNDDGDFETIWDKDRCEVGWNNNQWFDFVDTDKVNRDNIVSWDEVRRSMSHKVPRDEVLKFVRASLSRMMKRKDNIVLKEGIGKSAVHKWNDWAWVTEMTAYVKLTNSKNRKEGDTENGWTYTKVRSRKSHGHEIADFVWKPTEDIHDYYVKFKVTDAYYYNYDKTDLQLFCFSSKTDAENFASTIGKAHLDNNGHYSKRIHKGHEKIPKGRFLIKTVLRDMTMKGEVDPDEYMSPQEVIQMFRNASPSVLEEHYDKFEDLPNYGYESVEVEEEVVA